MESVATSNPTAASANGAGSSQYVTFICADVEYGVEILRVQEIKGWDGVTRVPYTPSHVLGVMNLRGVIVPVIDLRTRFGLEAKAVDSSTVVIVVRVQGAESEKTVGIVVDAVSEVYSIAADAVKPTPEMVGRADGSCVSGLTSIDDKMIMLLDMDRLIASSIDESVLPAAAN